MPCFNPLTAFRTVDGDVVLKEKGYDVVETLVLGCGQCDGCKAQRTRDWSLRIVDEARERGFENCSFATATYDDEHLPPGGTLVKADPQVWFKRMRKRLARIGGPLFSYYCGGEYGERTWRPHYHVAFLGFRPLDGVRWKGVGLETQYTSPFLEECWGKGQVTWGELSPASARYVAGYIEKKRYGRDSAAWYQRVDYRTGELVELLPEFSLMSTRPAIGLSAVRKFGRSLLDAGYTVNDGKQVSIPKYYVRKLEEVFPDQVEDYKLDRALAARGDVANSTVERLKVRSEVFRARLALRKRDSI